MQYLLLERDGVELAAIPLSVPGLEVGSAPGNGLRLCGHGIRPFHLALRFRQRGWWAVSRGAAPLEVDGVGERHAVSLEPPRRVVLGPYRLGIGGDVAAADGPAERLPEDDRTRPSLEPAAPAGTLWLRWTGPDGRLTHRRLDAGVTVVGRAADCDVVLCDPAVSARHVRVTVESGRAIVEDLASLNGCRLDDRRVFAADLLPGATLRLGGTELQVVPSAESERAAGVGRMVATPGLAAALEVLRLAAFSGEPCVLTGETGCGKEVLARRLHELGPRRGGPFVAVNAAALPAELAESLLFGHQRGAFTGALEAHRGAFERADRGTLFLDELGEMRLDLQAKLLRVLEEGAVLPVGSERAVPVDVRVVAATNREPAAAVRSGRLRLDLWHRLAVFVVRIPPLRARPRDLGPLAGAFLAAVPGPPRRLTAEALRLLGRHRWPGNVRELRNVVIRAASVSAGPAIDEEAVRRALDEPAPARDTEPADAVALLAAHRGNIAAAARAAGLPRTTFRDLVERERRRVKASDGDVGGDSELWDPGGGGRRLGARIGVSGTSGTPAPPAPLGERPAPGSR
ncbi:MAG: sigma 54-dependent Fis family transcriptional regulator [Deltaproteobacteria bacterium]|nr:sigma 54-dependent Fis family transcriptional regulator [Deltaproteobacteria bacterium]